MATYPSTTSAERAQRMRESWAGLRGGAGSVFVYFLAFFTAYPPLAQGLYYLLSGLWPLLSVTSHQQATGHQGDLWYAEEISVMLVVVGATLCLAAYRRQGTPEVLFLAFASALALTAVDIHLIYRGFSVFYLVDAALEVGLVVLWIYGWRKSRLMAAPAAPISQPPALPVTAAPRV